ncbi:MAG TPA: sulfurtransferase [Leifsonia sp.]|jgi:thiosulfate/3-mercaptopyruvate sulfurtransferase|nr:sulfurtransferase [Leifsonia sp.]
MTPLIDAQALAEALTASAPPTVLDVRWKLGGPPGRPEYERGHIPGAVYVDLDTELARHGEAVDGRHPLPRIDDLVAAARSWGLDDGDAVVVYDDLSGLSAARAWWLLRSTGFADVRVLDGGLAAWIAADGALEAGSNIPEPGTVKLEYGAMPTLDADAAAQVGQHGVLLDARAPERFRGEVEPIDPRAGHIPGALSAPTTGNLDPQGRMLAASVLADRFASLGITTGVPVGVYCGSGVTAAHEVLALEVAGYAAALYPGSWSAWSNEPARPVATGD